MGIGQGSSSCTHTLFIFQGGKIEHIFALWAVVSKIRLIFKMAIFGHKTWPLAKVPEFAHIPPFYPRGSKLSNFTLRTAISEMFKLAIFGHETWPLAKVPKVAHILTFYPRGVEMELIFTLRAAVSEIQANFQSCHVWAYETWQLTTVREVAHILPFYPRGVEIELISLYEQRFPRYRLIFKIAIFGYETWFQKLCIYCLSTLGQRGSKLSFFSLYGQPFLRHKPIFKIAILGHETWPLAKVPEVAHIPSFYPRRADLSLSSLYGQLFLRYGPIFKIAMLQKLYNDTSYLHLIDEGIFGSRNQR